MDTLPHAAQGSKLRNVPCDMNEGECNCELSQRWIRIARLLYPHVKIDKHDFHFKELNHCTTSSQVAQNNSLL